MKRREISWLAAKVTAIDLLRRMGIFFTFPSFAARKKRRLSIQQESLFRAEPNDFEQKLIHDMFLSSVDLNDFSFKKKPLPSNTVYMSDTNVSNLILSQPEDRNAHNKIFGGFLMRQALELSWITAFNFCKKRPTLEGISDISFHKPVNVSSAIKMDAKV